ncbi:MAG: MFS transporter [Endozoicomonas sp. (ex Botrylloides leachii)]|nr:MFS transporter [Endozoicomonas sp. (ex Botrylloides leachii)]
MQDKLHYYLITITLFAVISDTMLQPFYPIFFKEVFHITNPNYVGIYLAAMIMVVMLAFPFWARLAKGISTLTLLIYTQLIAGFLSILCYFSTSAEAFWLISLTMVMFKASYLLVYPYMMSLEDSSRHSHIVGILTVIVHFGAIGGASAGGFFLGLIEPKKIFLLMSMSDFLQMIICFYIRKKQSSQSIADAEKASEKKDLPLLDENKNIPSRILIYPLAIVMLVFYFSAQITRPFFSIYWETVSGLNSSLIAGFAYAIPAWAALLALWQNRYLSDNNPLLRIAPCLLLGLCGLLIQSGEQTAMIIIGRCLYGWALFQVTVKLDMELYNLSTPERYATDFSKIYMFQSLGSLLASLCAGLLVSTISNLAASLLVASAGWVITLVLFTILHKQKEALATPL